MKQAALEDLQINFEHTIEIKAAPGDVFEGLIHRICHLEDDKGNTQVELKLERWPGGRWFRDLDAGNGHLWGFVQAIKPPTLIELFGPMFMSYPVAGHLMVRLSPIAGGTKVVFRNDIFGPVPAEMKEGLGEGWMHALTALKRDAEK